MIPFALFSGRLIAPDGSIEIRAVDLSPLGFTFRLAKKRKALAEGAQRFCLHLYDEQTAKYREIQLDGFSISEEEQTEFYMLFRVETEDIAYRTAAKQLMAYYARYAELKLAGDGAALSKALTGYPAEGEKNFSISFMEQRRAWLTAGRPDEAWKSAAAGIPETGIQLDRPEIWKRFLSEEDFAAWFWHGHDLAAHPISKRNITHIYIGNAYCQHLFPDEETLFVLLEKAKALKIVPVVQLAPVDESRMDARIRLLGRLAVTERHLEILVNDWGTLRAASRIGCFSLTLGTLLAKRRKDSRMTYFPGFDNKLLEENAVNADFFREALASQGVERISCEACGYAYALPEGRTALHLPFYQMNTAGFCTLAATCQNGDRGRQRQMQDCPEYCKEHVFLYPDMLRMVGRDNTIFGYDEKILVSGPYLKQFAAQGVKRLVVGLL